MRYSLARDSRRSVVCFAMPALAGLMVIDAFIPPTPGPIAVAELLGADLGNVILFGAPAGLPAVLIAGRLPGRRFAILSAGASCFSKPLADAMTHVMPAARCSFPLLWRLACSGGLFC